MAKTHLRERGREQKSQSEEDGRMEAQGRELARCYALALKIGGGEASGVKSQGMQAASRNWKRQTTRFSSRVSRRKAALPTSRFLSQ